MHSGYENSDQMKKNTIIRCCDVKSIIWYPFLYLFADLIAYTFSVLEAQAA